MKKIFTLVFILVFIGIAVPVRVNAENAPFLKDRNYVSCGTRTNRIINKIPSIIPEITEGLYNSVMIIVPAIMIGLGMFDLFKGIISQKEDEIKKGRESLVKRLITGFLVFLVVMLVKVFVSILTPGSSSAVMGCVDCFIDSSSCIK